MELLLTVILNLMLINSCVDSSGSCKSEDEIKITSRSKQLVEVNISNSKLALAGIADVQTSKREADVGNFYRNESRTVEFVYRNGSKKKLKIKQVRKPCGCAKASASPMKVAPGKPTVLTAGLLDGGGLTAPFAPNTFGLRPAGKGTRGYDRGRRP